MTQEEFYQNIDEWISKDRGSWNHITLMAYFCHKYAEKHRVNFRLVRWKGDPGKGKESRDFSKLMKLFLPEDFSSIEYGKKRKLKDAAIDKVYNYINWMFDYKFRRGDKSVTGTGLFLLPSMINEFERMYSGFLKKSKTENNVSDLIDWAKSFEPDLLERHQLEVLSDIKMIQTYISAYDLSEDTSEARLIGKAKELGVI